MNELKANIEAIKSELAKPEVSAALRMATPELYAHVVAVVAVYDIHLSRETDKHAFMMQEQMFRQQLAMADYKMKDILNIDAGKYERPKMKMYGTITADQPKPSMLERIGQKLTKP